MSEHWIKTVFELFRQGFTEGEVVDRVVAAECTPALAETMVAFLPLACGRIQLAELGVALSPSFRVTDRDGEVSEPRILSADPHWKAIQSFIDKRQEDMPAAVRMVGMRSPEYDAVSKAILKGSKPADLVGADPIFLWMESARKPKRRSTRGGRSGVERQSRDRGRMDAKPPDGHGQVRVTVVL